jgi:hypothetical protein
MNKRRLLLPGLGVAVGLGLAGFVWWFTLPEPRINQQSFEQIQVGMTVGEVVALFRVPPGNYTDGRAKILHEEVRDGIRQGGLEGSSDQYKEWVGQETAILVWLDDEGKVSRKEWIPMSHLTGSNASFFDKLRRWFRL